MNEKDVDKGADKKDNKYPKKRKKFYKKFNKRKAQASKKPATKEDLLKLKDFFDKKYNHA